MTDARERPAANPAPIDCEAAARRLWDFLDGELDPAHAAEVEAHLATCRRCPPHFAFAQRMAAEIGAAERAPTPPDALRARVLEALRAEGYAGGPG